MVTRFYLYVYITSNNENVLHLFSKIATRFLYINFYTYITYNKNVLHLFFSCRLLFDLINTSVKIGVYGVFYIFFYYEYKLKYEFRNNIENVDILSFDIAGKKSLFRRKRCRRLHVRRAGKKFPLRFRSRFYILASLRDFPRGSRNLCLVF